MTVVRRPDALWRRLANGVVVLGAEADHARAIFGPPAEVWDLIAKPVVIDEIVDQLATRHGADRAVVAADVRTVIDELAHVGALEYRP